MDKPYRQKGYNEMEHYQPAPYPFVDWPPLSFPAFPGPAPVPGTVDVPGIDTGGLNPVVTSPGPVDPWFVEEGGIPCSISVITPHNCDSESAPDWTAQACIRFIVRNLNFMPSPLDFIKYARVYVNGVRIKGTRIVYSGVGICDIWVKEHPDDGWQIGDILYVEVPDRYNKNGGVRLCSSTLYVHCFNDCACPGDTFSIDEDSTPDTINAGSSVVVYVTGGCEPYTYSVSGTGYHWANGKQTFESNSQTATLYCVSGT
jgi:hypothetical protein